MPRLNLPKEKTFVGPALLWKRIIAFIVDLLIVILFVLFPFRKALRNIVPENYSFAETYKLLSNAESTSYTLAVYFAASILMFLYFYMMEARMTQTIGKRLMNIYVTADNEMKKWQILVRNLLFIPIFPFDLLIILDPLFMFFTKTNQRLSEVLSKTNVVEVYSLEQ